MRIYSDIPEQRPLTVLLDSIETPDDVKKLKAEELQQLADELRHFLLWSVGHSGGHLGASLGVIELTIALHSILDTPKDQLIWDVGHQSYPHKILTQRRGKIGQIRKENGLKGFPSRDESIYDAFGTGHSSTSVSASLGMAIADHLLGNNNRHVAVLGDGAATAGMVFEALSHGGFLNKNMLVILNDNSMSISPNIGGLSQYFARLWAMPFYFKLRENGRRTLGYRTRASRFVERLEFSFKSLFTPGGLFQDLGWHYVGPLDGHDIKSVSKTIKNMLELQGPNILHLVTRKGAGWKKAEVDPLKHHSISGMFQKMDAEHIANEQITDQNKSEQTTSDSESIQANTIPSKDKVDKSKKCQDIFGEWLCTKAETNSTLVGITPAMREGSGMVEFSNKYRDRFFDVAIAEQHAVTFAAGMATRGLKPVVAIYSTFLQRAYDQLIHDVALQKLDVTFAVDRAGLVGEDGPTHMGNFDVGFARMLPNVVIAAPSCESEMHKLLDACWQFEGTTIVRYPRGTVEKCLMSQSQANEDVTIGKAVLLQKGLNPVTIFAFGPCVAACLPVANRLNASLFDMRFVKPLDEDAVKSALAHSKLIVCVEESSKMAGIGQEIVQIVHNSKADCKVLHLGIEDEWIEQATRERQLEQQGLDSQSISRRVSEAWQGIEDENESETNRGKNQPSVSMTN